MRTSAYARVVVRELYLLVRLELTWIPLLMDAGIKKVFEACGF